MRHHADADLTPLLLELEHRGFRNLADDRIDVAPGATLLVGDNGSGKTSLLEAVYVAVTTRSFRATQLAECVRHGAPGFRLAARCRGAGGERADLAVSLSLSPPSPPAPPPALASPAGAAAGSAAERSRTLNGKASSLAEHLAVQPIVAWTTAERTLLVGPPAARRRFLDRGMVAERPAALDALSRYHRALEQKRALLAARRTREIDAWNEMLAAAGADLARQRAAHVERLAARLNLVLPEAGHGFPAIEIRYRPNPAAALDGPRAFLEALEAAAGDEARRRQPLLGPHRDDLEVRWGGLPLKGVASAGERKALGLALLAAQVRVLEAAGRPPLALLDDADVELDRQALGRSWRLFAGRQLLATSNRPEVFDDLPVERRERLAAGVRIAP